MSHTGQNWSQDSISGYYNRYEKHAMIHSVWITIITDKIFAHCHKKRVIHMKHNYHASDKIYSQLHFVPDREKETK